ncbi:hypothetical protein [Luteimonas terrae]|uniref:Uncharacterized protein n=1 Tax=Luteimonas terrae TaxID=1530191 RepID=A0A4R5U5Y6_9GAMM|nr:hypothetical protein [Luteimonas terrae]TDK29446.1 hypothetical protein E2F49_13795 [Luteimonas terrae]
MNAVAVSAPSRGLFGDTGAALAACTLRRHRFLMGIVYCVLLGLGALLGAVGPTGSESRADGLGFFVLVANFSIWAGWFARLLLLQSTASRLRAPGVTAAVRRALLWAALVTLVVPATILFSVGVPTSVALGAPLLGVLGGLLFSVLPAPAAFALLVLPGLAQMFSSYLPPMQPWHLAAATAAGAMVLAVCVRSLLRARDPEAIPAWRRPLMLQAPAGMVVWTDPKSAAVHDAPAIHDGWMVAMPRPDHAGPHAPRAAIDMLLAGPMGYLERRATWKQWGFMILAIAVLMMIPFRGDTPLIRNALLVGVVVGLLASGWTLALRLERQRRRLSAELSELALLPGLGTPAQAGARMRHSVMRRLGQLMLFAFAGLLLLAWMRGLAWPHVALLLGMLAGTGAASLLMCATAVSGSTVASVRMFLLMLPLMIAAAGTLIIAMIRIPLDGQGLIWTVVWTILTVAYGVAALVPLRRSRARPHAFLLD